MDLDKERTHLANECTFLSYVRTGLSVIGFGLIMLRFGIGMWVGVSSFVLSVFILAFGLHRFMRTRDRVNKS